jgi:two-component system sensor histidine kinase KdpD
VADYLRADCFAVYVSETGDLGSLPISEREAVERHLNFARNLQIETRILEGRDVAATVVDFARRERITQIFLTRPREGRHRLLRIAHLTSAILRLAQDMQVTVVAQRGAPAK